MKTKDGVTRQKPCPDCSEQGWFTKDGKQHLCELCHATGTIEVLVDKRKAEGIQ